MEHSAESRLSRSRALQLCHDLRQYVAAGLLVTQLPADGQLDPLVRARFDTLREVLLCMRELVSAELDGSDGKDVPLDVLAVVEQSIGLTELTHRCSVAVRSHGRAIAAGDPVMLRRALMNVLDNAGRAAGEDGTITVEVRTRANQVLVDVTDDGQGFGRIESVSGHGLSVVDLAVRRLRGHVAITSPPGAGTRVRLTLPAQRRGDVS
jgi:signal transduction histidine kinase